MARDRDDELNSGEFSLEEILAEFGGGTRPRPPADDGPDLPWPEARHVPPPQNVVPFPGALRPEEGDGTEEGPEDPEEPEDGEEAPPEEPPPPPPGPEKKKKPEKRPKAPAEEDKILPFPEDDTPPLQAGIEHLKRKADEYAAHMFEEEGSEVSEETMRFQRLIPGVDEEERREEEPPRRER